MTLKWLTVVRWILTFSKCSPSNHWNLWTCYITCKKDFADVIKLWVLRWRDYSGLSGWVHRNHRSYNKRKTEESASERDVQLVVEVREILRCYATRLWRQVKGPGVKECRWSLAGGKCKEMDSPPGPPEVMQVYQLLDFSQVKLI